jgi:D-amino-acid dehydrogenase
LHLASRACYKEWALLWGNEFDLVEQGLLVLCNTERGLEEEVNNATRARQLGIPAEVLTPKATAELEPNVRMAIAGSVYFPLDCHLTPGLLMAVLTREVERAGESDLRVRGKRFEVGGNTNRRGADESY